MPRILRSPSKRVVITGGVGIIGPVLAAAVTRGVPGQTDNIGGRVERRNLPVAGAICDLLDRLRPETKAEGRPRRELIAFVADRRGRDRRHAVDPIKVERELGWRSSATVEQGIERTIGWHLEKEAWRRPLRNLYGGRGLGLLPYRAAKGEA